MLRTELPDKFAQALDDGSVAKLATGFEPQGGSTGKAFKGMNALNLLLEGKSDPRWYTEKQIVESGWKSLGVQPTRIEYWDTLSERPKLFNAFVYNAANVIGDVGQPAPPKPGSLPSTEIMRRVEEGEALLHGPRAKAGSDVAKWSHLRVTLAQQFVLNAEGIRKSVFHPARDPDMANLVRKHKGEFPALVRDAYLLRRYALEPEKREEIGRERAGNAASDVFRAKLSWQEMPLSQMPGAALDHVLEGLERKRARRRDLFLTRSERYYLHVPYRDREEAEKAGAVWSRKEKAWYAGKGTPMTNLSPWDVTNGMKKKRSQLLPQEEFSGVLKREGFPLKGPAMMDGEYHEFCCPGDKEPSMAYRGSLTGILPRGEIYILKGDKFVYKPWVPVGRLVMSGRDRVKAVEAQTSLTIDAERPKKTERDVLWPMVEVSQPTGKNYAAIAVRPIEKKNKSIPRKPAQGAEMGMAM